MVRYNRFLHNKECVIQGGLGGAPRINSSVINLNNNKNLSKIKL